MSLSTVNTGIVNHTHSRMGSIMSTGIVQGMLVLFLNFNQICYVQYCIFLFYFKDADEYYLAVAFSIYHKVLQLYRASRYGKSEIIVASSLLFYSPPPFFSLSPGATTQQGPTSSSTHYPVTNQFTMGGPAISMASPLAIPTNTMHYGS